MGPVKININANTIACWKCFVFEFKQIQLFNMSPCPLLAPTNAPFAPFSIQQYPPPPVKVNDNTQLLAGTVLFLRSNQIQLFNLSPCNLPAPTLYPLLNLAVATTPSPPYNIGGACWNCLHFLLELSSFGVLNSISINRLIGYQCAHAPQPPTFLH